MGGGMILVNRRRRAAGHAGDRRPGRIGRGASRFVCASLVAVVICVLLVEAYANSSFRPDHVREAVDQGSVPADVLDGGPVLDARRTKPAPTACPREPSPSPSTTGRTLSGPPGCWTFCTDTEPRPRSS